MKTLKLFNAVVSKDEKSTSKVFISDDGYIIEPGAVWAKDRIVSFYEAQKLSGEDLNKTFHKSWAKIKNSSRFELLIEQIRHYISTYGSNFQDEVYIPNEVLDVPDVKLTYKVVKAYTKEELIGKCLDVLSSGIALKEETIDDVLSVLTDELSYVFTGNENIRNKEAVIKIADLYGVLPSNTMEFFRYIIYRATGDSLLIKSRGLIERIKSSTYNPGPQFTKFGEEKLAEIFNRFKPLFLAFKTKCPKTINRISKLSKKHHKPMVTNPLSLVTSERLTDKEIHWLDNATPYAIFKAMAACLSRINGQDTFVYRIRNGKSYAPIGQTTDSNRSLLEYNYAFMRDYLKNRFSFEGLSIYVPEGVEYALPTSEKMYVGNVPTGTRFFGESLAVGMYWENKWGARDLDLSGINVGGKVGWNAAYHTLDLSYSGDITNAPDGAVEYLHAGRNLMNPTIAKINVYSGSDTSGYNIIVGKGHNINRDYMMDPNNLMLSVKTECIEKQMLLGIIIPATKGQSFILLNFGAGAYRVSRYGTMSDHYLNALYQQWRSPLSFNTVARDLGAVFVDSKEEANLDLSLDNLEKDTFTRLFTENSPVRNFAGKLSQ